MARKPATAAARAPRSARAKPLASPASTDLASDSSPAAATIGTARRKLKRAASGRLMPLNMPADMVAPEREMPGAMATACARPTASASATLACSAVL